MVQSLKLVTRDDTTPDGAIRMNVSGGEVRVRVEPQHEKLPADFAAVPGNAVDRPHGNAVIAAQHERQLAGLGDRTVQPASSVDVTTNEQPGATAVSAVLFALLC